MTYVRKTKTKKVLYTSWSRLGASSVFRIPKTRALPALPLLRRLTLISTVQPFCMLSLRALENRPMISTIEKKNVRYDSHIQPRDFFSRPNRDACGWSVWAKVGAAVRRDIQRLLRRGVTLRSSGGGRPHHFSLSTDRTRREIVCALKITENVRPPSSCTLATPPRRPSSAADKSLRQTKSGRATDTQAGHVRNAPCIRILDEPGQPRGWSFQKFDFWIHRLAIALHNLWY